MSLKTANCARIPRTGLYMARFFEPAIDKFRTFINNTLDVS